jgi:hypothetical protein
MIVNTSKNCFKRHAVIGKRCMSSPPPLTQPAAHSQRSALLKPYPTTPLKTVPTSIPKPPSVLEKSNLQPMQIKITPLSYEDVKNISLASEIVRDILNDLSNIIKPGVTTDAIDEFVHNSLIEKGAYPGTYYNIYIYIIISFLPPVN